MAIRRATHSVSPMRWAFAVLETLLVLLTFAALADNLLDADWGLSWSTFFVGMIGSVWALVIYQLVAAQVSGQDEGS